MPKQLQSTKKLDREREVAQELYDTIFPEHKKPLLKADEAVFAFKVGDYYYKVVVKEAGRKL